MEVTINYNGQALSVEVTVEVYEYLDRADHKTENLAHEQRRHWRTIFAGKKRSMNCLRFWTAAPRRNAAGSCSMRWTD